MTALETSVLEADIESVEAYEANLGTIVNVTLPTGEIVTGILSDADVSLQMLDAGYGDRRRQTLSVRRSQFTLESRLKATDIITILEVPGPIERSWRVESRTETDAVMDALQIVQNW